MSTVGTYLERGLHNIFFFTKSPRLFFRTFRAFNLSIFEFNNKACEMSSVGKRPVEEPSAAPSKRLKQELPTGFFDNEPAQSSAPSSAADGEDEEWQRFQAEMADDGQATSTTTESKSSRRLELLGLNNASTISADAQLANDDASSVSEKPNGAPTSSKPSEGVVERSKKIDIDKYADEDAADELFNQLADQEELYERVDRMKALRLQRSSHKHEDTSNAKGDIMENDDVDGEAENSESDSGSDGDEDDMWRKRGL